MKKTIVVFIVFLFLVSIITPIVIGFKSMFSERDEYLEKLAFVCSDRYGFLKLAYYEELFQREFPDIVKSEELTMSIDSPSSAKVGGPMDSPWPMKCHDVRHTGRSPYSTADNPGIEKWRFKTKNWVDDSSVIGDDDTIYFGCWDRYLYAIYPDGILKWKYKTGGIICGSSPAIAEDGTIYIGSWDCKLHAIYPNGTKKWDIGLSGNGASSPAIAEDGTIYIGAMGPGNKGRINAINPNGSRKWYYDTGYWIVSDPAIGDDGTVYIGSGDKYLYAMWPNGTLRWRFGTGDWVNSHPSIAEDGTIYFSSFDGRLYALYLNGTMKWRFTDPGSAVNSASIAEDGTIYLGGDRLYALYPNGTIKWIFDLGGNRRISHSSPAVSADGTIYVGTNIGETSGGEIIAVNSNGTEKWRKMIANKWVDSSPSIAEDGTVYIGSAYDMSKGYLHAFGPIDSNEPPNPPSISGAIQGSAGKEYKYTFVAVDSNNNPVSYYIDWGDGTTSGWTQEYASGEQVKIYHTFENQGTYNISAKAKDVMDEESDWGYLDVTMPKNKATYHSLFLRLLERFPIPERFLNLLIN